MQEALALSHSSRALLAEKLIQSLGAEEDDEAISPEWLEEIKRRCDEIDSGRAELVPMEEVFAEARARLRDDRSV